MVRAARVGGVRALDGRDPGGGRARRAARPHRARAALVQLARAAPLPEVLTTKLMLNK